MARGMCSRHYMRWYNAQPDIRARRAAYDRERRQTPEHRQSEAQRRVRDVSKHPDRYADNLAGYIEKRERAAGNGTEGWS